MDEPGPGIVLHSALLQPEGGLPQRLEACFGDPKVDRLPREEEERAPRGGLQNGSTLGAVIPCSRPSMSGAHLVQYMIDDLAVLVLWTGTERKDYLAIRLRHDRPPCLG